jgi:hypothetical protein
VSSSGQDVSMNCLTVMEYDTPLIGERGDSFVISLQLNLNKPVDFATSLLKKTGYFELSSAMWISEMTKSYNHRVRIGETMRLDLGWVAIAGSPRNSSQAGESLGQLIIYCTASSIAARWGTLIDISDITCKWYSSYKLCSGDETATSNVRLIRL